MFNSFFCRLLTNIAVVDVLLKSCILDPRFYYKVAKYGTEDRIDTAVKSIVSEMANIIASQTTTAGIYRK